MANYLLHWAESGPSDAIATEQVQTKRCLP